MTDRAISKGSEHWFDPQTGGWVLNTSTVPMPQILSALEEQHPEIASIVRWTSTVQQSRNQNLFERDKYVAPANVFAQMRLAYEAARADDVVSNVVESTEAMAFQKLSVEADDEDEQDVWNQLAGDLDLDSRFREMWRELFTVSQFTVVTWWGTKDYKVRGKTDKGVSRKKTFNGLNVPTGMSILDPLKVVPVGNFMFNQEQLAYIASRSEWQAFNNVLAGVNTTDLLVAQAIVGPYEPSEQERLYLASLDINPDYLFLLNPKVVWRHTDTRAQYERFANVRMKSVFELLDLKQQLREKDRATLIGGTNFIVLVKIGSSDRPAKPQEVQALAGQVKVQARVPVIVGDDRLSVEIITPKLDHTLSAEAYNVLDSRIEARLYQMFLSSNSAVGKQSDDSLKMARVIGRGLEGRRHQLMRSFERNVLKAAFEKNTEFTSRPKLLFHPKMIALDYDQAFIALLQDLRDRGDLSRSSILDQFDFDQDDEARKRELEAEKYDKVFGPTNVPYSGTGAPGDPSGDPSGDSGGPVAPHSHDATGNPVPLPKQNQQANPADTKSGQRAAGRRQGGNKSGGGANVDSKTPNAAPARPRRGKND